MSDTAVAEPGTRLQNFLDRAGLRGFPWKTATILYTISWGWLFIVRDSYWVDDWTIFSSFANAGPEWDAQGVAPWLKLQVPLFRLLGPTLFRLIIFVSVFVSGVLVFVISKNFQVLNFQNRSLTCILFLILPFNTSRVALMTFPYTLGCFLFFFAWSLWIKPLQKKTLIISLVICFFSFMLHSLLPYFTLLIIHKIFILVSEGKVKKVLDLRSVLLCLLLPVIYWILRSVYWPEEVKYHDVSFSSLSNLIGFIGFTGCLLLVLVWWIRKLAVTKDSPRIILAGILCFFFGSFAYVVLGFFAPNLSFFPKYIETFLGRSDWYSRHQTLQPLGVALLIVGVIGLLPKSLKKFTIHVQALILAVCVVFNVGFGFEYVVDHAKQKEVVRVLEENGESKLGSDYQFVDQTTLLNSRGREYRERDWNGLIWLAYGVESMRSSRVATTCDPSGDARLVLIRGPETHWEALKNWVSDGDMGFKVTVDDTPGACKPEMVTSQRVSGAIPILFYFTGAKG